VSRCSVAACFRHAAQRTAEVICARCRRLRWVPDPIIPLTPDARVAGPPIPLVLPYTCQRCRAVLAGQRATDPLVSPERRAQLTEAARTRRNHHDRPI